MNLRARRLKRMRRTKSCREWNLVLRDASVLAKLANLIHKSINLSSWDHNPLIVKPGETAAWTYTAEEDSFFEDFMRWCEHDESALNFQRQVVRMSMSFCAQMGNGVQQAMYTHEMKMQFDDFVEDFEVHILKFLEKHEFEPTDVRIFRFCVKTTLASDIKSKQGD